MVSMQSIVVYGASGHAQSLSAMLRDSFKPELDCETVAFVDDVAGGQGVTIDGRPVLSLAQWRSDYREVACFLGMGTPAVRAALRSRIVEAGGTFVDVYGQRPRGIFHGAKFGAGCFVGHHTFIGCQTTIGEHVQVLPLCSIGHDVIVGDFSTVCPSCTISGHVVIEEGVFIGAGTTIVNGTARVPLRIGRGAKIWAGSVVTGSLAAGATVGGNPAMPLRDLARRRRVAA